jgi:hypothetical protein
LNTLLNNLGLASVQFAFWSAIAFVLGYSILAKWWRSEIGWARVSLDIAIALALSPTLLHVIFGFRVENSIAFAWYQVSVIALVGCVSLWNLALVIRTQFRKGR